jgi:hypothetical protein
VDADGYVKAVSSGRANIIATVNGVEMSIEVLVY